MRRSDFEKGLEKGGILEKQNKFVRFIDRKFGISREEKVFIQSITDDRLLDDALDAVFPAKSKDEVLCLLKE